MTAELVTHVFASLQSLEKKLEQTKKLLPEQNEQYRETAEQLPKQEEILGQMRKVANLLQLQTAKGQWEPAVRSLKIFYGLNHMVRTDVMKAYGVARGTQLSESRIEENGFRH